MPTAYPKTTIDFIGIGAQKAGTTWLYSRLCELPQFTMPSVKELHYFDRSKEYPTPNQLSETFLLDRLKNRTWVMKSIKVMLKNLMLGNLKEFKWLFKWYFSSYNDNWYLSLFDELKGIKGEISPAYSILKENDIERMSQLCPNAKLIFILRNPIERAWSQYRSSYKFAPEYSIEHSNVNHVFEFMNSQSQELRTNYIDTIGNYLKYYPENQILIAFYDAIIDNPHQLLSEIVSFVGGNNEDVYTYCRTKEKDNVSREHEMQEMVKDFLKEKYHPLMLQLSEKFGGYCTKWYLETYSNIEQKPDTQEKLSPTIILNNVPLISGTVN